jgi:hypothetical protein
MSSKKEHFPDIFFGELFENLQLLSQLKLKEMLLVFNEGKRPKILENFKNTCLSNQDGFQKKRYQEKL